MSTTGNLLPQWTWDDLEAALEAFSPLGPNDPVRDHLLRGLAEDASRLSPRELLQQVLSAGWVMAQMGARSAASAGSHRPGAGPSAC
jgi:hypothetical protein